MNCFNVYPLLSHTFLHSPLTIKVDVAVFVEVNVAEDLLQLAFLQLLPQEGLHALLQLLKCDLTITITVKLQRVGLVESKEVGTQTCSE